MLCYAVLCYARREKQTAPAGTLITFTELRAHAVPDRDKGGGKKNVSDPYLKVEIIDATGRSVEEKRTSHIVNATDPCWPETLLLLLPATVAFPPTVRLSLYVARSNPSHPLCRICAQAGCRYKGTTRTRWASTRQTVSSRSSRCRPLPY
jgi:hypothetical protein